jgi:5-methylcytosine-specific restriction endonuclease McrA
MLNICNTNIEEAVFINVIDTAKTYSDVVRMLGITDAHYNTIVRHVKNYIDLYDLDVSHFYINKKRYFEYETNELQELVNSCKNKTQLARAVKAKHSEIDIVLNYVTSLGIDTSHFIYYRRVSEIPLDELQKACYSVNSFHGLSSILNIAKTTIPKVSKYILDNNIDISHFKNKELTVKVKKKVSNIIKNYCDICKTTSSLEIHHIDGNHDNENIDNLQVLCKNCHSQTIGYSNMSYMPEYMVRYIGNNFPEFMSKAELLRYTKISFYSLWRLQYLLHYYGYTDLKIDIPKINTQSKAAIKNYLICNNIIPYRCSSCGISDYNNKPLFLEMHHIDGNSSNNEINNLTLLCPSCHSMTDSHSKPISYR